MDPNHPGGRCNFGDSPVFGTWAQRDSDDIANLDAVGHLDSETERTDIDSVSHFGFHAHLRNVGRSTTLPTFKPSTVKSVGSRSKGATSRIRLHRRSHSKRRTRPLLVTGP